MPETCTFQKIPLLVFFATHIHTRFLPHRTTFLKIMIFINPLSGFSVLKIPKCEDW